MKHKKFLSILITIAILTVTLPALTLTTSATTVSTLAELQAAIDAVPVGGTAEITVGVAFIAIDTDVTLDGAGKNITINMNSRNLSINNNGSLTLQNITIDGGSVAITGGTLEINAGAVIQNGAPGIFINTQGGTITMNGGKITGNINAGIQVTFGNGTFIMNGGEITGNGIGVQVSTGGTFTMNGGKITDNRTGVQVSASSSFTMNDGEITGNNNIGVFVSGSNGSFTMSGGEITDSNTGVYVSAGGSFTMDGGEIKDNDASGVLLFNGSLTMNGGEISNNTGGGVRVTLNGVTILGGTAKITGNTADGRKLNLQANFNTITLGTGENAPAEGMSVGVTTPLFNTVFVQSGATADHVQYFFADAPAATIAHENGQLRVVPHCTEHICDICERVCTLHVCSICGKTCNDPACTICNPVKCVLCDEAVGVCECFGFDADNIITDIEDVTVKTNLKKGDTVYGKDGEPLIIDDLDDLTLTVTMISPPTSDVNSFFAALLDFLKNKP